MSRLSLTLNYKACRGLTTFLTRPRYLFTSGTLRDSDRESSEDKTKEIHRKEEVHNKINDLLLKMTKNSEEFPESVKKIEIPKPRVKAKQKHIQHLENQKKKEEEMRKADIGYRLEQAAQEVAQSLGGDTEKTEMELLDVFLTPSKSEINKKNMSELLFTMKIERGESSEHLQRAYQIKNKAPIMPDDLARRIKSRRSGRKQERIDIFGELPFNIFSTKDEPEKPTPSVLETWNYLHERDLHLSITHPPSNIFEQMIMWTEQGKIWKFPIDNEQDWPENENIDFTEHVFLERHIEPWCPKTGPVRTFMELICIGLSKNPYLTADEKRAHIAFFEHYFRLKNPLLEEAGIGRIPEKSEQEAITN